ncbi:hypothetical protein [Iodidimonas sp. SYSU 1G8]|uniref:hypothetical protein n=1 Tax=Iodidimonas sp. SYSU 1G8 TaxID=3133967 RepID=UPI0031FF19F7
MTPQMLAYLAVLGGNRSRVPAARAPRAEPVRIQKQPTYSGGSFKHAPKPHQNRE